MFYSAILPRTWLSPGLPLQQIVKRYSVILSRTGGHNLLCFSPARRRLLLSPWRGPRDPAGRHSDLRSGAKAPAWPSCETSCPLFSKHGAAGGLCFFVEELSPSPSSLDLFDLQARSQASVGYYLCSQPHTNNHNNHTTRLCFTSCLLRILPDMGLETNSILDWVGVITCVACVGLRFREANVKLLSAPGA